MYLATQKPPSKFDIAASTLPANFRHRRNVKIGPVDNAEVFHRIGHECQAESAVHVTTDVTVVGMDLEAAARIFSAALLLRCYGRSQLVQQALRGAADSCLPKSVEVRVLVVEAVAVLVPISEHVPVGSAVQALVELLVLLALLALFGDQLNFWRIAFGFQLHRNR